MDDKNLKQKNDYEEKKRMIATAYQRASEWPVLRNTIFGFLLVAEIFGVLSLVIALFIGKFGIEELKTLVTVLVITYVLLSLRKRK